MKTLLALAVFLNVAYANITVGYLAGAHFPDNNFNNSHPFVDFGNVLVFQNSFDRVSFAGFYKFSEGNFHLRVGATTGYSGTMSFRGNRYYQDTVLDLLPFVAPSYEYQGKYCKYIFAILGNSANIGIGKEF